MVSEARIFDNPTQNFGATPVAFSNNKEAVVSLSVDQITDITMDRSGALLIEYENSDGAPSKLLIENFKELAGNEGCIKLNDGAEIDSHILYDDLCNKSGICTINKPSAGSVLDVPLQADKQYDLRFDVNKDTQNIIQDKDAQNKLVLTFADGAKIVFQTAQEMIRAALDGEGQPKTLQQAGSSEFLSALEVIDELIARMKTLEAKQAQEQETSPQTEAELAAVEGQLAEKLSNLEPADGEKILSQDAAAEQLAQVEPAAGANAAARAAGASSAGGYGFQSIFNAAAINPLKDVGPINPTALQYGVDPIEDDPFFGRNDDDKPRDDVPPVNYLPEAQDNLTIVDETDGFVLTQSGTVSFSFGNDGAGFISPAGWSVAHGSLAGGALTSSGVLVEVTPTSLGYIGVTVNGDTVFTLTIDPQTGNYQYNQILPLDHADGSNPNDIISLDFGVSVTDGNGDSVQSVLTVQIADDAPVSISHELSRVDETNLSPDTHITGQITADFGNDGAGSITGNGQVPNVTLTSGGEPVTITYDPVSKVYVGATATKTIFSLVILSNGTYDFALTGTLDHPDPNNPNEYIRLDFGVRATDFDGDSIDGTLTIKVLDDAPTAVDDCFSVASSVNGNVITNDHLSQDVSNNVSIVTFNGTDYAVPHGGQASINGDFGTLLISSNGSFTYTLNSQNTNSQPHDEFQYTLRDGDGDTSVATLVLNGITPTLIVGKNVDDTPQSTVPHYIGGGDGEITGQAGNDILVGDIGGSTKEQQTQDYNFVFIVDVSGSMATKVGATARIDLLKSAVMNILNDVSSYQNGEIKVHISPFSTTAQTSGTFTVTDPAGLDAALKFLDALKANGYTNYEAPMQEAIGWLQSGDPIGGNAITTTYFISDGEPNRYLNANGVVTAGNVSTIIGEITGGDGTNEVALLKGLSDEVIGVGINISGEISRLNVIDSDGKSLNVKDPNDLQAVLQSVNPIYKLASVGDDVLSGGAGDDIIFGDSVNTDQLAQDQGLSMPQGQGWKVFDELESNNPSWDRNDTTDYIRTHANELAVESHDVSGAGRSGGDDNISGGAGNDTIFGQEGNDVIYGGAGNDILSGGSGSDQFLFQAISEGIDVIRDFNVNEGDVLDFSGLIHGFDPTQQAINDFVFARVENGGTILSVDVTGSGNASAAVDIVALEGVNNIDLQALFQNGNINVY